MARKSKPPSDNATPAKRPRKSIGREVRELWDTLVLAFVLVTLMKTFIVDLYKIPTGSMTPTLIGDYIRWQDFDNDGDEDLLLIRLDPGGHRLVAQQVFIRGEDGLLRCETDDHRALHLRRSPFTFSSSELEMRYDRILVNKLWYWFFPAHRGDIVVFKLPDREDPRHPGESLFDPLTPFYIKRLAALGGEVPTIDDEGHLLIDGEIVTEPEPFTRNHYFNTELVTDGRVVIARRPLRYLGTTVPEGEFYVFGDNSGNSLDSRYWGGVELDRLRGRAFMRYWPPSQIGLLD
jgi:signal peptidase I